MPQLCRLEGLTEYRWPGNIREGENLIRAVICQQFHLAGAHSSLHSAPAHQRRVNLEISSQVCSLRGLSAADLRQGLPGSLAVHFSGMDV